MSSQATREKFASMAREAEARGLDCVMFTITLPSRFHPLRGGMPNPNHCGETPRDGQQWLLGVWAKARAGMARVKLHTYGMRVVEPHHDATPHWHALMFMRREEVPFAKSVISRYVQEDGEDCCLKVGHLCDAYTAVAYAQRFEAKAKDVQAWGAVWGIRLGGFFGLPDEVGAAK